MDLSLLQPNLPSSHQSSGTPMITEPFASKVITHYCKPTTIDTEIWQAGDAIDVCFGDGDGNLWVFTRSDGEPVGNGEYGNRVNFCPFCGIKSRAALKNPIQKITTKVLADWGLTFEHN